VGIISSISGRKKNPMDSVMREIAKLIENEEYQNDQLNEFIKEAVINGESVDSLPGATGPFGFDKDNPIPANGPIGEIAYLSRLEIKGEQLLFHRIGAVGTIDVFEAVTFSGSSWHIFFMDFYHPRRSRLAPEGFRIAQTLKQFSGFSDYCQNFPYDFPEKKASKDNSGLSLAYIALSEISQQLDTQAFKRSIAHNAKIEILKEMLTSCLS